MHFHLPKPLHGWRAFAGEVGIIVLGVLLALAAQQLVEEVGWHDKVSHAEAAMRLELSEDDGPQAYARLLIGPCLNQQIGRIHDGAGRVPADQLRRWIADYSPPFRSWDSEAWKAVIASDVGSHMGADRLVQWSAPYRLMPSLTERNADETALATELHEALPPSGGPTAGDAAMVRRTAGRLQAANERLVRGSQLLLARLRANGAMVSAVTQRALLSEARSIYGGCVRAPDLSGAPVAQSLDSYLRAVTVKMN
jgi:hypothetical protein